eukprot:g27731.t1
MIGSLIGGPVLPSSLRTSMWPMRRKLSSLYLPFWAQDIRSETKLCRIILLGVMGDGQGIKKMVGSTWNGAWCCPSCKLRFVELTKGRWITSDFRVFLPRNHPFRTDPRYKTHEWYVRYGRRGEAMNANLLEDQKAKHIKGVKYLAALSGVPGFDHFIRMTWQQTQAETNNQKSQGHKVKPLPRFHIRKKQAGEDFQEYQTAMREAKQKHDRDTKLVEQALIDYQELGLDAAARYEVCNRFISIMAPRGMKGTGSPYGNFGSFKSADASFFFKYCPWIFDGIDDIKATRLATIKKNISEHSDIKVKSWNSTLMSSRPSSVEIAHGIPKTEHTYWLHQFACKVIKQMADWGPLPDVAAFDLEREGGESKKQVHTSNEPERRLS